MGIFHLPRLHVFGAQLVNAGTGNNDSLGPGTEITITSDTAHVRPVMHGMEPKQWREWVVGLDQNGLLRCQWNYYGDMSFRLLDVRVVSVQHRPGVVITDSTEEPLIGSQVHLDNATVCDNDPEGFNTTQIFADSLTVRSRPGHPAFGGSGWFVSRRPTRAVTRGLNWSRNVSFHGTLGNETSGGAAGASAGFQCSFDVDPDDLTVDPDVAVDEFMHRFVPGSSPTIRLLADLLGRTGPDRPRGLTFRYNLHLAYPRFSDPDLATLFSNGTRQENPAIGVLSGTIAPWYPGEPESGTIGRVLNPTKPYANPYATRPYFLAPATARVDPDTKTVTVDLSNTLPADGIDGQPFDLGTLTLGTRPATAARVDPNTNASVIQTIGEIDPSRDGARARGYLFDLEYSTLPPDAVAALEDGGDELVFCSSTQGVLLYEPEHHVLLDSECNYLDDPGPTGSFGRLVPTLRSPETPTALQGRSPIVIYRRGQPVTGPMAFSVEQWRMTPSGDPNNYGFYQYPIRLSTKATVITVNSGWGSVDLVPEPGLAGMRMFRFVPQDYWPQNRPPDQLAWLLLAESYATLRVLPYDDYATVLAAGPTWADVYREVMMYYELVLPAMNERLPISDPSFWQSATTAHYLKRVVDPALWSSPNYMPRTRDLSAARRRLVVAYCDAVLAEHRAAEVGEDGS